MGMAGAVASIVTNSEGVNQRLSRASKESGLLLPYFRFNVGRDVGDIGLEEWKRVTQIAAYTATYLGGHEIEQKKIACATFLIAPTPDNCK